MTIENNQDPNPSQKHNIVNGILEQEMKTAYLDYAMSVIIGRALPEVRDGLKPVHRRILYAMNDLNIVHNKPYKKCARIVGEVLGKYHPHGDTAVYDTLVRMAQSFSLKYPLIQGQGNFGSIDGDNAAAMRYTEARLAKITDELLRDIEKETVDVRPNFDESLTEPVVLPTRFPNLLVNGSNGIAVGMATNIPPHNISEVIDGTIALLENEETEIAELHEIIKGPDFPTGGIIIGRGGISHSYQTGRGKYKIRSKIREEEHKGRKRLIVTEIPYQVNKSMLLEQIAENVRDKRVEGISDLRDESDRKGMRIVIELKKDASVEVVQNQLFKHTRLQIGVGSIYLAIVNREPKVLNLKEILGYFIEHRKDVIKRRTEYDLRKAEKKLHILEGLKKALDNIDSVIKLIKEAESGIRAKEELISNYDMSEEQAQAILDMKLQRLTGLEQDKIKNDYKNTIEIIEELRSILASAERIKQIIKDELLEINEKFGEERHTEIADFADEDIDYEDLIPEEDQVVTISQSGYVKRIATATYKVQNRGGKGIIGSTMKEEDVIEHMFIANTHSFLLIFTNKGRIHWLKVYKIPETSRQAKGKAIVNLINLEDDEKVASVIPVREFDDEHYLVLATKNGVVKKTNLTAYSKPRQTGIIGITLDENDDVINAVLTDGKQELMLATAKGQAVRFNEQDARPIGRTSRGVRGISLAKDDCVISMILLESDKTILTMTENGYGKRTNIEDYRLINRGGKGVRNIVCSERNGNVVSVKAVDEENDALLISQHGIIIRTKVAQINVIGRNTQGVRLMRLKDGDKLQNATLTSSAEEECDDDESEEKTQNTDESINANSEETDLEKTEYEEKTQSADESDIQ